MARLSFPPLLFFFFVLFLSVVAPPSTLGANSGAAGGTGAAIAALLEVSMREDLHEEQAGFTFPTISLAEEFPSFTTRVLWWFFKV